MDSIFLSFTTGSIIALAAMSVLLFCSAMISGSEIAFFSLGPQHILELNGVRNKRSKLIVQLLESPKRLLATILITNNFVNVSIVILATYVTTEVFNLIDYPYVSFFIEVVAITVLLLFFGEIMPKVYATQRPVVFSLRMANTLSFLIKLFYPLSSAMVRSTTFMDNRLSKKGRNITRSELTEAVEITADESTAEKDKNILKGIIRFGDIDAKEIMKSRTDVTAVDINLSFHDLLNVILEAGYSRIPVFEDSFDQVKGILYIKDLLPHIDSVNGFLWQDLIRPAMFVPEKKKINDLLKEIQEKKIHMAIVVDEYGGTSGIITLEDILEEIVGEISDEFDSEDDEISYKQINDNTFVFEGKTTINDFCKIVNLEDNVFDEIKGDSDSLAGVILELTGKIPDQMESVIYQNFKFHIEAVDDRRIKEIKVEIADEDFN